MNLERPKRKERKELEWYITKLGLEIRLMERELTKKKKKKQTTDRKQNIKK